MKKVLLLLSFIAVRHKRSSESFACRFPRTGTANYRHFEATCCAPTRFALPHWNAGFIFRFVS